MLRAAFLAASDLFAPALRRIVWISLGLAAVSLITLWASLGLVLAESVRFGWWPIDWLVDLLGAVAAAVLSWLLFPAVVTLVMGFFLDRIAAAVEALHYPGRGAARRPSIKETMVTTIRLMAITLLLNLLALPVYVLLPAVNFFVFVGLNGYLFGREYFEVVALRRLEPGAVRALRSRFPGRVFSAGAAIAGLFAVPFVNLVAPVLATAFMMHLFEAWRSAGSELPASRFA